MSREGANPMSVIGIMQGRLSPPSEGRIQSFPRETWRDEFPAASAAGLDFIEWIHDEYGLGANPIQTAAGRAEMKALAVETGVAVPSICADLFMERPLLKCALDEQAVRLGDLKELFEWGRDIGVRYIVLPFVDASRMESAQEIDAFVAMMHEHILPMSEASGIEAHLETSLPPSDVAGIARRITHNLFKINYDSGNSSSLGYNPRNEFAAYGSRIGSFHIKDRINGGTTVPLGTGDANFVTLRECLQEIGYRRSFVMQVARGEAGHEIELARANRHFAEEHVVPVGV